MSNNIKKSAFKFVNKNLKGQVNLKAIVDYLNQLGYIVHFFDDTKGQDLLKCHNLSEYAKSGKAFTLCRNESQIVFVNDSFGKQETLHLIIHETAHIVLGHLDRTRIERDRMREESEADMFTYIVLYDKPNKLPQFMTFIGIAVVLISVLFFLTRNTISPPKGDMVSVPGYNAVTAPDNDTAATPEGDTVYITPYGKKYHEKDCHTIRGSNLTAVSEKEAKKNYEACKICKP